MNCNFILRYIFIVCLLITVIVILYKINNYKKIIANDNNCELIEYEWNLEDEIRKFMQTQDLIIKNN